MEDNSPLLSSISTGNYSKNKDNYTLKVTESQTLEVTVCAFHPQVFLVGNPHIKNENNIWNVTCIFCRLYHCINHAATWHNSVLILQ